MNKYSIAPSDTHPTHSPTQLCLSMEQAFHKMMLSAFGPDDSSLS